MLPLYKFLKFVFRHLLPEEIRYPMARFLARLAYLLGPKRRRTLQANLAPIVGPQGAARLAPRLLANFSMTAVDFFCPRRDLTRGMEEENYSILEKAYRRHKKVIVVTAHLGNWELGMSYLLSKGFSMAGVYAPYREDEVVRWIMSHRNPDVEWIPAARGAAEACLAALERGRLLGLVADIPFGERGHRVKICGAWAHLPLGPWSIAARSRAVVVPGFVLRIRPGSYRVVFHDVITPKEGSFRRQLQEMQEVYRAHLESYLKAYPEQWGCLQPFWDFRRNTVVA